MQEHRAAALQIADLRGVSRKGCQNPLARPLLANELARLLLGNIAKILLDTLQGRDVVARCHQGLPEGAQHARRALVTEVELARAAGAERCAILRGVVVKRRRRLPWIPSVVPQSALDVPDTEGPDAPSGDDRVMVILEHLLQCQQLPPCPLEHAVVEAEVQDGVRLRGSVGREPAQERGGDVQLADARLERAAVGGATEQAHPQPADLRQGPQRSGLLHGSFCRLASGHYLDSARGPSANALAIAQAASRC
mmetsp:Transcript_63561/g.161283  ORF Transcript_63561/g.161283 Transcript_63561/m.161283 type:complete len:252 (-) Transcript_63561:13-768(-)